MRVAGRVQDAIITNRLPSCSSKRPATGTTKASHWPTFETPYGPLDGMRRLSPHTTNTSPSAGSPVTATPKLGDWSFLAWLYMKLANSTAPLLHGKKLPTSSKRPATTITKARYFRFSRQPDRPCQTNKPDFVRDQSPDCYRPAGTARPPGVGLAGRVKRLLRAPQKPHNFVTRRLIPTGIPRTKRHTPVHLLCVLKARRTAGQQRRCV